MSGILQNAKFAFVLTALIVIIATLSGANSSLGKLREEAESSFYHFEDGDNMGIQYDLERIEANSGNLITVALRYLSEDDEDVTVVRRNIDKLRESLSGGGASEKKQAASNLVLSARFLADKLEELELQDRDRTYVNECRANIRSHEDTIARSGYNQAAREFNSVLRGFPASVLSRLVGVKPLELYE